TFTRRSKPVSRRRSAPRARSASATRTFPASAGTTKTTTPTSQATRASARTAVCSSRASASEENEMERIETTGFTSATDSGAPATGVCASCGQPIGQSRGLQQFLDKLGITDEMIKNLNVDEYLNIARDYLKTGTNKATAYAKEHPAQVAAGAAALAIGA